MVWFYIALYPVHWTAQSALHFPPLADLFIPTPFSASLGSILAMQQLRNDYSLTFPPLSIARYSFIQLSRLRCREVKENAQTSKRYQRGFEPGLSRLRVRHSTTEPPRKLGLVLLVGGLTDEEQNNVATSLTVRITIKLLTLRNILYVNVTPGLHRH